MKNTTIALLGATGKAGRYILKHLINRGYTVKALLRKPDGLDFRHPKLVIVPGDVRDAETVSDWTAGCTAVVSALGQTPGEPLVSALVARHVINAMQQHNIKRYIFLAGLTVDVQGDQKSEANQAKSNWMRQHYPGVVDDKQQAYQLLLQSTLEWTMIRLPWIEQTEQRRNLAINLHDCPGDVISTADLAAFIALELSSATYVHKAPFVASI
ncbi:NAD(P)H-binding protein [Mucilaginibacter sp. PAMB04168]|uniref:NAD(P)-dependent oxidoreductase n=1 Tax=Mucilaginibacter sp. PAMB04168 TaxID=3138567 RepID=UPI0031F6E539